MVVTVWETVIHNKHLVLKHDSTSVSGRHSHTVDQWWAPSRHSSDVKHTHEPISADGTVVCEVGDDTLWRWSRTVVHSVRHASSRRCVGSVDPSRFSSQEKLAVDFHHAVDALCFVPVRATLPHNGAVGVPTRHDDSTAELEDLVGRPVTKVPTPVRVTTVSDQKGRSGE
jgi:hypothetical protein